MKTFSDGTPVPMKLYSDGLPVEEMTREELCAALLIVVQERDQARDEARISPLDKYVEKRGMFSRTYQKINYPDSDEFSGGAVSPYLSAGDSGKEGGWNHPRRASLRLESGLPLSLRRCF